MNISSDTLLHLILAVTGGAITISVGVVGWLLNRAIKAVDDSLILLTGRLDGITSVLGDHQSRLVRIETMLGINVPAAPAAHAATAKTP